MRKLLIIAPLTLVIMFVASGLLAPGKTSELLLGIERSRAGLEEKSVSINGEPWPYLEKGPEDGQAILLLHGFGGDKDNWLRFARALPDNYRVIIPDLPGFGDTNRYWDQGYSIAEQARRLERFVAFMNLDSVHIVGHSMGGHIAGYFAGQHPDRVRSLGLVTNAGVTSPEPAEFMRLLENGDDNVLSPRSREEFREMIVFTSFEVPFIPWPVGNYVADKSVADADFKEYVFKTLRTETGAALEPILPGISAPVFVLWGRHDRLLDVSSVDVIRELKPGATTVILEESGHLPILEEPKASAAHYGEFLSAQSAATN